MNNISKILAFLLLALSFNIYSDHHEMPTFTPMESFSCNYNPGMDIEDDLRVTKNWNKYIDTTGINYSAWLLHPYYTNDTEEHDVYWIGFTATWEEMGKASDIMLTKEGAKIQAQYDKVTTCAGHDIWGTETVRASKRDPGDGYLTLSSCSLTDEANPAAFEDADKKFNEYADSVGDENGSYRWYPGPGVKLEWSSEYDFLLASTTDSLSSWGSTADRNVNGGGNQVLTSLYGNLMQCEDMRVFKATAARINSSN
jgi:hypothetical protein